MRRPIVWLSCLLAACSGSPAEVLPGREFELELGQAVRIAGTDLNVSFVAVEQDSRCPADVTCVWAGDASVNLRLLGTGCDTLMRLHTHLEPRRGEGCALSFEVRGLEPTPRSGEPPSERRYRLRLLIPAS